MKEKCEKAEVAILQKEEAAWAKKYTQQCEGKDLLNVLSSGVTPVGLDVDHWQRIQLQNLQQQVPDPGLKGA